MGVYGSLSPYKIWLFFIITSQYLKPESSFDQTFDQGTVISSSNFYFPFNFILLIVDGIVRLIPQTQVHIYGICVVNLKQEHNVRGYFLLVDIVSQKVLSSKNHILFL